MLGSSFSLCTTFPIPLSRCITCDSFILSLTFISAFSSSSLGAESFGCRVEDSWIGVVGSDFGALVTGNSVVPDSSVVLCSADNVFSNSAVVVRSSSTAMVGSTSGTVVKSDSVDVVQSDVVDIRVVGSDSVEDVWTNSVDDAVTSSSVDDGRSDVDGIMESDLIGEVRSDPGVMLCLVLKRGSISEPCASVLLLYFPEHEHQIKLSLHTLLMLVDLQSKSYMVKTYSRMAKNVLILPRPLRRFGLNSTITNIQLDPKRETISRLK